MTAKTQNLHLRLSGLIAAIIFVSGCASLSKEECQTANWKTIGYEDGAQGRSEARIGEHRKACAEYGVAPELETYRSGREEGISRFCKPGNGYQQGRSGKKYTGVCPDSLETAFLQSYRDGRALYKLEANISRLTNKLTIKRKRLAEIDVQMRDTGIELVAKDVPTERRVVLLDELRKLGDERSGIKAQIPRFEADLKSQKQRLTTMSNTSAYKVIY